MSLNKDSLKIYELYGGTGGGIGNQTLSMLYAKKNILKYYNIGDLEKTFEEINGIRKYFSDFSTSPYLVLENLNFKEEDGVFERLKDKIIPWLWENSSYVKLSNVKKIKRIENPSGDKKFMKHLLHDITSEDRTRSDKSKELFYLYAEKNNIPLIMEHLDLISSLYNEFGQPGDSLDD